MGSPSLAALIVALQVVAGPTLLAAQSPAGDGTTTASVDPLGGWTFSATLEGFYEWNFNRPPDRINLLRAYDTRANMFGIQQVALVLENAPKIDTGQRFGMRLDLQFGLATETVQGNPANEPRPDVYRHVGQASCPSITAACGRRCR